VLVLVFVAVAFAVGAGAAALAATGNLRVDIGARQKPAWPVPTRLSVPPRSHGLALVAGGKLWLATRNGLRIEGMPGSAAGLSPRALYAVVGLGSPLVALAPGNRRPWVHPAGGRRGAARQAARGRWRRRRRRHRALEPPAGVLWFGAGPGDQRAHVGRDPGARHDRQRVHWDRAECVPWLPADRECAARWDGRSDDEQTPTARGGILGRTPH